MVIISGDCAACDNSVLVVAIDLDDVRKRDSTLSIAGRRYEGRNAHDTAWGETGGAQRVGH